MNTPPAAAVRHRTRYCSDRPGPTWEDGLAIGDGSVGALLWGSPDQHVLTFAHEEALLPTDPVRDPPDLAADLPVFRELIATGHAQQAADLAVARSREQGYPGLQWTDPLVPVAALALPAGDGAGGVAGAGVVEHYRRDVVSGGRVRIGWHHDGHRRSVAAFVSRADHVTVVVLRGCGPVAALRLSPPDDLPTTTAGVRGGNARHVRFERPAVPAGLLDVLDTVLVADWCAPLRVRTSLVLLRDDGPDGGAVAVEITVGAADLVAAGAGHAALQRTSPTELYRRHLRAAAPPGVVTLDLGAGRSGLPTETLLTADDPVLRRELLQLQLGAAQQLIADSTGRYPPTLQGIWSGTFDPAWSSDLTMNGNVQNGALAAALATGNPEQLETFLALLEGFRADLELNAAALFGTDGIVLPSRCSPRHGRTTHFDADHCHEFWTAGGAWAAAFFLDLVAHTGDLAVLRERAYPFACAVERFYADFLVREKSGTIVFTPSYSPENRSATFGSQACRNATMDRAALAVLLRGLLRAAELLGADEDLTDRRRDWLASLPPYRVAPDGTLAEWLDAGVEENLGHRTASQLLGLWFEPDPELLRPPLRTAVHALVDAKLAWRASEEGVEEMAYGLVQLGLAAAATGHAAGAQDCLDRLSRKYFRSALTTTHDVGGIFNADGSGGLAALVCAVLVGSHAPDRLVVLPALPPSWPTGTVTGVHARGALVVERLEWDPDRISLDLRALPGSSALRRGAPLHVVLPAGWHSADPTTLPLADGEHARVVARRGR